jgi:hypothetical protein
MPMASFEFDLIFSVPEGRHDAFALSDAVFGAGFEDAVIGTGRAGLLAVGLECEGDDAESVIVASARSILAHLPEGSALREVRPDLVSLGDVAERLKIKRQALQKREMPTPAICGHYRVTEVAIFICRQVEGAKRQPRFDFDSARAWFDAGKGAQCVNARIALGAIDPRSLQLTGREDAPVAYQIPRDR